jgi:hypothetical protein
MRKGSAVGRFSITAIAVLVLPAFAAAQHHGGGMAFAPAAASRPAPAISRATPVGARATGRTLSGPQSATRIGTTVLHARNGGRIIHRTNGANFAFNGTDFQDVPGLGFDYPHLAAISGNRRNRGGRFGGGVPFGFSGFLLGPSVIQEDAPVVESQPGDTSAVEEQEIADDAPPAQRAPRRSRSVRRIEPEADSAPPAPPREEEQYVFVRRDGSLVFAVAYAWESGTLRYITPDGLRRTIGRDALDLDATQQFNEQRGVNFRSPA